MLCINKYGGKLISYLSMLATLHWSLLILIHFILVVKGAILSMLIKL